MTLSVSPVRSALRLAGIHRHCRCGAEWLEVPQRWKTAYAANVALVIAGLLVGLFVLEAMIRLSSFMFLPKVMVFDTELGWFHRADTQRSRTNEDVTGVVSTNALGLRGPLHIGPTTRPRLLVMGDSYTDGFEVPDDDLFSVRWQRARPDLEIDNAGVGGYSTVQELLLLRRIEPLCGPTSSC